MGHDLISGIGYKDISSCSDSYGLRLLRVWSWCDFVNNGNMFQLIIELGQQCQTVNNT